MGSPDKPSLCPVRTWKPTSATCPPSPASITPKALPKLSSSKPWPTPRGASTAPHAALEANILTLAAAHQPDPFASAPSQVQEAMALAASYESQSKALANLSLHSQRLSRQFEKTVTQLRDLQKIRLAHEEHDMNHLLDIMEMYEEKGEPYNPSEDGFVFTKSQLARAIRLRNRDISLAEAYETPEETLDD